MDELQGIWADDSATYLVDMRHPIIRKEWTERQLRLGRLPFEPVELSERRQFDREMVAKYGEACPPPPRAEWLLKAYDIMDAQERRENKG